MGKFRDCYNNLESDILSEYINHLRLVIMVKESEISNRSMNKPFTYNPPGTGNSQNSISVSTHSQNASFYSQDGGMNGERVRVAVRIRPMMKHEHNHNNILEVENMNKVFFKGRRISSSLCIY